MRHDLWTPREDAVVASEYLTISCAALGERLGRSIGAVWNRGRLLGVSRKIGGPHRDPAMMAQIAAAAAATSYGMAARKYGLTRGTVAGIVRDVHRRAMSTKHKQSCDA